MHIRQSMTAHVITITCTIVTPFFKGKFYGTYLIKSVAFFAMVYLK